MSDEPNTDRYDLASPVKRDGSAPGDPGEAADATRKAQMGVDVPRPSQPYTLPQAEEQSKSKRSEIKGFRKLNASDFRHSRKDAAAERQPYDQAEQQKTQDDQEDGAPEFVGAPGGADEGGEAPMEPAGDQEEIQIVLAGDEGPEEEPAEAAREEAPAEAPEPEPVQEEPAEEPGPAQWGEPAPEEPEPDAEPGPAQWGEPAEEPAAPMQADRADPDLPGDGHGGAGEGEPARADPLGKTTEFLEDRIEEIREEKEKSARKAREPASDDSGGAWAAVKGLTSFFTIFRMDVGKEEIDSANRRLHLSPMVGLVIGLISSLAALAAFWMCEYHEMLALTDAMGLGLAASATYIAASSVTTRFLHMDGLADFGDGVVASGSKEARLRALKDTCIGAGGMSIAMMVVLITFAFLSGIGALFALAAVLVAAEVFSKNAMVAAAAIGIPGYGMAAAQVSNTSILSPMISSAISVALSLASFAFMGAVCGLLFGVEMFHTDMIVAVIAVIASFVALSALTGAAMARSANKRFGFVNGDVLGATNEITRAVLVIAGSVVFHALLL
ncbi:MAG: adenosylcobinamide-GDP ribazoletransferase [Candidatus Methanoplasma sp.]|jgi:adenosylcobinamide-GDP ribazoletransferase|nr:adenosylcobinamide-GDP ribazoletransferase [Candidatus Methanoplasma sp.]